MFDNIPDELKEFRQWVMWKYENRDGDKPTKVPYSTSNYPAAVDNPNSWGSFEQVKKAFETGLYSGIGFVLTDNDPFAFIDLDATDDAEQQKRQHTIFQEFNSYAELSPSGNGLHIIVRGSVEHGRKRSKIEVYSNERYMTMTGNVYRAGPVNDCQVLLADLWEQLGKPKSSSQFYQGQNPQTQEDAAILEMAGNAVNGPKFRDLWTGNFQQYYETQSQADLALVDMLAFYTQNAEQIKRMFRTSALGQRKKAQRDNYIGYMMNQCFDRMLPPVDIEFGRQLVTEAIAKMKASPPPLPTVGMDIPATHAPTLKADFVDESPYTVPPGLVGEMAQYIYQQSVRPVPEIALAAALGLMAGIVGRSYNVSSTGLNQYILVLAPTGYGKESLHGGIDRLMQSIKHVVPSASEFIGPGEIASAPALLKYLAKYPSIVSVVGEFGYKMKEMSHESASPHMEALKRLLLDLYNKSGNGKMIQPMIYSQKENNTSIISAPTYTMLGESTPETYYSNLTEQMISDGLLPRMTVFEYRGSIPPWNENFNVYPPAVLQERLAQCCAQSLQLNAAHKSVDVNFDDEAKEIFTKFRLYCEQNMSAGERNVKMSLWSRAHMRAMKLAALVAVGVHFYAPIIDKSCANWAINIVLNDTRNILSRFDSGEIGIANDENDQFLKMIEIVRDYVISPYSKLEKYRTPANMHAEKVVPYSYLHKRLNQIACYKKSRMGTTHAIKTTIKLLIERGDMQEVSKSDMAKRFESTSNAYMITNLRTFDL